MKRILLAIALVAGATPALAHSGHGENGLVSGLLHPLTGMDHMAAMLLVGLWAGLVAGRALWMLPVAFVSAMLAGFGVGAVAHVGASPAEFLIIASLLALGGAVALKLRAPLALSTAAVGLFGFAHGLAHGIEAPGGRAAIAFAAGFVVATAALHGLGLLLVRRLPLPVLRFMGVAGAGLGLVLAGAA